MNNLVKIKSYKVRRGGLRGLVISLPIVWVRHQQIQPSDCIAFYQAPNSDELILKLEKTSV